MPAIDNAVDSALGRLSRMPTIAGDRQAPYVRTMAVFGRPPTGIALPLNRKTTQQAIVTMPVAGLEPRQELVSVKGLQSYIIKPRRDPPDVARVKMRDGRERLLIQEGHTRIGAAVMRGDPEMPMRVWEFQQTDTGDFEPVVRGRQRIYERIRDRPYATRLSHLAEIITLPNIADVSFPSMIGAMPSKPPKKKRKRVQYKGVSLSRQPMAFEVKVLSLTEIPPRLDAAVRELENPDASLLTILDGVAKYGTQQALLELLRQGAPDTILTAPPFCEDKVQDLAAQIEDDRVRDLQRTFAEHTANVGRRHLRQTRALALAKELTSRWAPGILKRHAKRAVNMAFALGRAAVIEKYRRPRVTIDLAKYHEDDPPYHDTEGKFQSKFGALADGTLWVDKVIHTAVMDTNTCEECEEVDGEEMELGDDRQLELHPPYVKCLGGDRCRCVQVAILSDGSEVEVDEVPEEAYPDDDED